MADPGPFDSYAEAVAAWRERAPADLVVVERDGARATVRLNDPGALNALSGPLTVRLRAELTALSEDPAIRAVVLIGTDPAFCAGGDLSLIRDAGQHLVRHGEEGATGAWRWIRREFGGVARLLVESDATFIAAVNGAAAGVGLAFALCCDVLIVSERAALVPAFGRIGLVPEVGTSWALTRRLGYQGAFDVFTRRTAAIGAEEAVEMGIASAAVAHDELMAAAARRADELLDLPPHVPAMAKRILRSAADMGWQQAIALEELAEPLCFTTRAHVEALDALRAAGG